MPKPNIRTNKPDDDGFTNRDPLSTIVALSIAIAQVTDVAKRTWRAIGFKYDVNSDTEATAWADYAADPVMNTMKKVLPQFDALMLEDLTAGRDNSYKAAALMGKTFNDLGVDLAQKFANLHAELQV